MNISRRDVLRMLGLAGAAALPLLGGGGRTARAGSPGIPRRVVFFYTDQGTMKDRWAPTAPGAPDPLALTAPWSTTNHTLGPLHTPLEAWKNKLLFLDGVDMIASYKDPIDKPGGHAEGTARSLTGAFIQNDLAGGPSIDQYIAASINSPVAATSVPSLELYVGYDARGGDAGGRERTPLYQGAGQPVPINGNPGAVYDRLFPNGPRATSAEEQAKLARLLAERKSVIKHTSDDFTSIAARLGKADRERLNAHSAALGDLSNRLSLASNITCTQPTRADIMAGANVGNYTQNADAMMRLIQTSFACDLTRVATLYLSELPDDAFGYTQVNGTTGFHDMIHRVVGGGGAPADLAQNPAALEVCTDYYLYYATQYAKLLAYLDAIPEADGSTLLDHTLVVWCGQIAAGDHSHHHLPYVLGGGMGGGVTTGRYVRYPRVTNDIWNQGYSAGPAHNDLFVSVANMMGVQTNTFGAASACTGPLPGLK